MRPWMASDITASEPEMAPTIILKTARSRFMAIAMYPASNTVRRCIIFGVFSFVINYDFNIDLI